MKPVNLVATRGSSFSEDFVAKKYNGELLDLTDTKIKLTISKYRATGDVFSIEGYSPSPREGKIKITISSESTKLLPAGALQFTLYITTPQRESLAIAGGSFIVEDPVPRGL